MNKRDLKYFNVAKSVSKTSNFPRIHIGAIIVYKNEIISVGTNSRKTHPIQKIYNENRNFDDQESANHFVHAEMSALIKVKHHELKNMVIYIYRENKNGDLAMCRPCPACMKYIKENNIKKIYYTTEYGYCREILE